MFGIKKKLLPFINKWHRVTSDTSKSVFTNSSDNNLVLPRLHPRESLQREKSEVLYLNKGPFRVRYTERAPAGSRTHYLLITRLRGMCPAAVVHPLPDFQ